MSSATPADRGGPIDWLSGAVDLHVHAAPSFFPRWGDGPAVRVPAAMPGWRGFC
jgi:hypothetical protein